MSAPTEVAQVADMDERWARGFKAPFVPAYSLKARYCEACGAARQEFRDKNLPCATCALGKVCSLCEPIINTSWYGDPRISGSPRVKEFLLEKRAYWDPHFPARMAYFWWHLPVATPPPDNRPWYFNRGVK